MSKSKSQIVRFLMITISALVLIIPMTNSQKVQAADITSSEVNSISTNVGQAKPGQRVYFTMTFGNSSQVIHTGDTIHVTFPQATDTAAGIQGIPHQIPVKYNNPSDPGDPLNEQTIATADISTTGVTITFNSKMNGHILTSGKLTFAGQIAAKAGTNPTKVNDWPNMGNVPTPSIHVSQTIKPSTNPNVGQGGTPNIIAPTGQVKKSGRIANNGNINWQVHGVLGDPGTTTITDTLKDGQTLVPGSIKITYFIQYQDGQWGTDHFRYTEKTYPASEGKITESSDGFTITANQYDIAGALMGVDQSGNQGNVRQVAYTITYQSKLSSTEQNDQWTNSATQTNPDGSSGGSTTATVKNSWQATVDGIQPKYGVKLQKVETINGQMAGLSGATFELTGNGKNLTATSNAAGFVEFSNLTAGTYTVKETKAPAGYSINNEKISVTIDDQGKTTVTVNGKDVTDNARVIDTPLAVSSSSNLSSKKSSSSKVSSSSKRSSSIKSSSSKESSSSKILSSKRSSSIKSSSSSESSLSKISSSSKKSSSIKSSSSKESSSSKVSSSSKESSSIKSSSSKESSSSKISSSKKSSSVKSSSSSKKSNSSKISNSSELTAPSKIDSSSKESSSNIVSSSSTASSKSIGANSSAISSNGNGGGNNSSKSQGSQSMTSSLVYTSSIVSISGGTGTNSSSGNGLPSKGSSSFGSSTPSQKPAPGSAFSTSVIIKSSYVQVPVPGSGNNNEGGPSGNGSSQNQGSSNIGNGAVAETGNTNGGNAQQNNGAQPTGNQSRENSSTSLKTQTSQQQAGQKGNSQQKLPQTGEASSIVIVSLGVAMIVGLGVYLEKNK
ncbi:SpaA isopeptide-forming pilin-related protein [Ligilactobacillus aviarius]|uniref:SpaA isopeptide-forming pilin-related protein n=1 Tax=Ligilactobacillus aviarius TaxID=1606 RepID=UPI0024BB264C|nr:SpaA isopeptide-forming pilin-related protein [Ligilactobacillus aviarius]